MFRGGVCRIIWYTRRAWNRPNRLAPETHNSIVLPSTLQLFTRCCCGEHIESSFVYIVYARRGDVVHRVLRAREVVLYICYCVVVMCFVADLLCRVLCKLGKL